MTRRLTCGLNPCFGGDSDFGEKSAWEPLLSIWLTTIHSHATSLLGYNTLSSCTFSLTFLKSASFPSTGFHPSPRERSPLAREFVARNGQRFYSTRCQEVLSYNKHRLTPNICTSSSSESALGSGVSATPSSTRAWPMASATSYALYSKFSTK